jgi:hypothetical protein
MPLYKRKWNCALCNKPVVWDSDKKTLSCGCGTQNNVTFVSMEVFEPLPKFDRKVWKETFTVPIDSAKFLSTEILLDGSQVLIVSDRESIFRGNENPVMRLRWIYYPERDKIQLCLEIDGEFHTEKLAYNRVNPNEWKGRMWIYIDSKVIPQMIEYLKRDPRSIHNWM